MAGVESASFRGGLIVRLPGAAAVPDHNPSYFLGDNSHGIETATFSASTCAFITPQSQLHFGETESVSIFIVKEPATPFPVACQRPADGCI